MSKTFQKVYLECFAHISANSQPFWLKIGPLEMSRVSGPLPVPVPAVTRTQNPQGLRNPCSSLITNGNSKGWFKAGQPLKIVQLKRLQLLRDVWTRWDSEYYMLNRLCELRPVSTYLCIF